MESPNPDPLQSSPRKKTTKKKVKKKTLKKKKKTGVEETKVETPTIKKTIKSKSLPNTPKSQITATPNLLLKSLTPKASSLANKKPISFKDEIPSPKLKVNKLPPTKAKLQISTINKAPKKTLESKINKKPLKIEVPKPKIPSEESLNAIAQIKSLLNKYNNNEEILIDIKREVDGYLVQKGINFSEVSTPSSTTILLNAPVENNENPPIKSGKEEITKEFEINKGYESDQETDLRNKLNPSPKQSSWLEEFTIKKKTNEKLPEGDETKNKKEKEARVLEEQVRIRLEAELDRRKAEEEEKRKEEQEQLRIQENRKKEREEEQKRKRLEEDQLKRKKAEEELNLKRNEEKKKEEMEIHNKAEQRIQKKLEEELEKQRTTKDAKTNSEPVKIEEKIAEVITPRTMQQEVQIVIPTIQIVSPKEKNQAESALETIVVSLPGQPNDIESRLPQSIKEKALEKIKELRAKTRNRT